MPIYDYSCTACRHLVEVTHSMAEPGPRFCPNCGAEGTMRKGFATPAIHYKGSGWAKKDRSSTSSSSSSQSAKSPPSESAGTSEGSSGAKDKVETPAKHSEGTGGATSTSADQSGGSGTASKRERSTVKSSADGGD